MAPFLVDELLLQLEALDTLQEWENDRGDLELEIHELSDGTLQPGAYSQLEDEDAHLMELSRRVH